MNIFKQEQRILSRLETKDLVGRENELNALLNHAREQKKGRGLLVLSAPADGSSELLRQVYDKLFHSGAEIIPVYFAFRRSDGTAANAARRFLLTFLLQTVAFRRKDVRMLNASPEIREIAELASPNDGYWIDRLVAALEAESALDDEGSFIRQALSVPFRAADYDAKSVVLFDDFQEAEHLTGGVSFISELNQIYSHSKVPFVIAGHRRHLLNATQSIENGMLNADVLRLPDFSPSDGAKLVEILAANYEVEINDETRDLIVQQLEAKPAFITALLQGARERKITLNSFQNVQKVYTEELLGGRIWRYFDSIFNDLAPHLETQREIIEVLQEAMASGSKSSVEFWQRRLSLPSREFYEILRGLHQYEILRLAGSVIEFDDEQIVSRDYIKARNYLEIENKPRALTRAELVAEFLERAPNLMARYYRRSASIGLRELLHSFDCQALPQVLFDYSRFKANYKGAGNEEINHGLAGETHFVKVPKIIETEFCGEFYPPMQQFIEAERCAVGIGYEAGSFSRRNKVYWMAAEIDSKLEATRELTALWIDRLRNAAVGCKFDRVQFWLIAPEGFAPDAMNLLSTQGIFASNRKQVELINRNLQLAGIVIPTPKTSVDEVEMTITMDEEAERIAAQNIEEFARRHGFSLSSVNQMKTALVEACINASEFSLSPDRKIHQKFSFDGKKLTVTVSNRGLTLPVSALQTADKQNENEKGRRGWGIKLMRKLMDEVEFEQVDDGTRIKMVKYLSKSDN
jgi:anti-sigma regulatory factor (Ser/Thr protein kinase)